MGLIKGRAISKGTASGELLMSREPISFYGGVDPNTGVVVEKGHPLEGRSVAGKILYFPRGCGSTVGSYILYRLKKNGRAPLAIINEECETIVAVGAIISEIPLVDKIKSEGLSDGMKVEVDGDKGTVVLL